MRVASSSIILLTLLGLSYRRLLSSAREAANVRRLEEAPTTAKPKIAFLFLIQRHLPFEEIWQEFFAFHAPKDQYNIYVHQSWPDGFTFPQSSVFYNRIVPQSIAIRWGTIAIVKATRYLHQVAYEDDTRNEFFMLFSESCLPLYSFSKMYRVLTSNPVKSIVLSCVQTEPNDMEGDKRWKPALGQSSLIKREYWRKSSEWIMLIRKHVKLFIDYKQEDELWYFVFCSDEHFLPTLLASSVQSYHDNQTTCSDGMTWVHWNNRGNDAHPHSYVNEEISGDLFYHLRFSKLKTFHEYPEKLQILKYNEMCSGFTGLCHFSARKFQFLSKLHILFTLPYLLIDDRDDLYAFTSKSDQKETLYHPPSNWTESYLDAQLFTSSSLEGPDAERIQKSRYPGYDFKKLFPQIRRSSTASLSGTAEKEDNNNPKKPMFYFLEHRYLKAIPDLFTLRFFFRISSSDFSDEELWKQFPVISPSEEAFQKFKDLPAFPLVKEEMLVKIEHRPDVWIIRGYERHLVPFTVLHTAWKKKPEDFVTISWNEMEVIPVGEAIPPLSKRVKIVADKET